jgi:hypothetical protein
VTGSTEPERRYRRLLALYPRWFREAYADELLGVLIAGADDGRRSESAHLIVSALRMRLRPPGTARAAVRLMYVAAAVELGTLLTVATTAGSVRSAILARDPGYTAAQWHAEVSGHLLPLEIGAAVAATAWLGLAWALRHGWRWARAGCAVFFAITSLSLANGVSQDAATYAPADLLAGGVLWLVALAALVAVLDPRSARRPARR